MPLPRKYKTANDLKIAINKYINNCKPINPEGEHLSVTGLAMALDFADRQSLRDYKGYGDDYSFIITRAIQKIEHSYELGLREKDQYRGCQFALSAGFGWSERTIQATEDITEHKPGVDEEQEAQEVARTLNFKRATV